MRFIATLTGVLTALVLMAVSAYMNYQFMLGQGKTLTDGQVYGAASVAMDMFKALAPFFFYWAWRSGRYVVAGVGFAVWVAFSTFSLISAIGYSAENRAAVSGSKEAITATYQDAKNELESAREKRKLLGAVQPVSSVASRLEAMKQHKRWNSTKGCTDATATASREFCTKYFEIKGTMGAAVEVGRLDKKIDVLQAEINRLRKAGAGGDSDPQLGILKTLSGLEMGTVKTSIVTFIAILIEIGSSLGLFLATNHSQIFKRYKLENTADSKEADMEQVKYDYGNLAIYLQGRTMGGDGFHTTLSEIYYGYVLWCEATGKQPYSTQAIHEDLLKLCKKAGFQIDGQTYYGLHFSHEPLQAAS